MTRVAVGDTIEVLKDWANDAGVRKGDIFTVGSVLSTGFSTDCGWEWDFGFSEEGTDWALLETTEEVPVKREVEVGDTVVILTNRPSGSKLLKGATMVVDHVYPSSFCGEEPCTNIDKETQGVDWDFIETATEEVVLADFFEETPVDSDPVNSPTHYTSHPSGHEVIEQGDPKALKGSLKSPTHFVPPVAKLYLAHAMADGAGKYGAFNWRKQHIAASVYMSAMDRHLAAWFDGEDTAEDSGVHHLAHVMACCAIVLDSYSLGVLIDDRPPPGPSSDFIKETK